MSVFYVYVLFRPWDGSPCYVGKGQGIRWMQDKERAKYNRHFAYLVAKAKRLNLEIPRIKLRENLTETEAFEIECALIKAIGRKSCGGRLVNLTDGGDGLLNPSDEVRAVMKAKAKQRANTPEERARLSENGKKGRGKTRCPETRAKMSKPKTPEHNAAVSAALRGKPKPYMVARNKARTGIKMGPHTESRCAAIAEGNRLYWERWRNDPAVREARRKKKER